MLNDIASDDYWGATDMVYQCLIDKRRALAFREAIRKSVKEGDIIVDAGTGTGILSMFAAEAGAKKIYAIEADKGLYSTLEKNFQMNGYADKIKLIKGDATVVDLPEKVDVVICEMIATGLIDELQIPVMNNIQKFCKTDTKIIPWKMRNYVELVNVNNEFYGHKMQVIQYEYEWEPATKSKIFSEKKMYAEIDFSKKNSSDIDQDISLTINKTGLINGIRISNESDFPDSKSFTNSAAYCMPLILPIEGQKVHKGDRFFLKLKYQMCQGLSKFNFSLRKEN